LTNAKQTALSADGELKVIFATLRTGIISTTDNIGLLSSVINPSQIVAANDERAAINIKSYAPYFSIAAQKDSVLIDATVFLLTHAHGVDESGKPGFRVPSDGQQFNEIVVREHQATAALSAAAEIFNGTKGIYVRDR
jgi:hypothetical protein